MSGAILVTGATGFLGSAIVEELVRTQTAKVYALVRPHAGHTPVQRLASLWCERPLLYGALEDRIVAVEGDIESDQLGLAQEEYDQLAAQVDVVVHAAAEVGVNQTRERFWDVNVRGTYNVLEFAKRASELGEFKRFVHISSAYVAGCRKGIIPEELFDQKDFNSLYEWSKHEAELLVSSYAEQLPFAIVRPAQIVGDSQSGYISTFNTLYYPLKMYLKGRLRIIPAARDLRVNMVPVDHVARLACRAVSSDKACGQVLHAVMPADQQPTLEELVAAVRIWAHENLGVNLPAPIYLPIGAFAQLGRARNLKNAKLPKQRGFMRNLTALAPYFYEDRDFGTSRAQLVMSKPGLANAASTASATDAADTTGATCATNAESATTAASPASPARTASPESAMDAADTTGATCATNAESATTTASTASTILQSASSESVFPDWRAYLPRLLAFAVRHGFLNQTPRTVYEQMMFRLRPEASTQLNYFDVKADGIQKHDGRDVRHDIECIAQALMARGVQPGDRIATIGVNSVRYFELDAAIGLLGAVNVPIYYTSATSDVYALVQASGAHILFAGTDRMLDDLDLSRLGTDLVSISDRRDLREGVESWDAFIARAEGDAVCKPLPWVAPDRMATIRYTSGTTGVPKGVVFDQRQVRWMGEVMPAVLDWRTRNERTLRYLSFLPMSHVVEGILVAYAPYYILADIEMYYLNDFPSLASVLPKVRPNLFFSVPRFYEKVWNQFAATGAGKWWIGLPEGFAKRAFAMPLRFVVLRRAGLDRCRQLIVGSAPIGLELLEQFRSLGIEIHNAFGVTEAPLITLSRLGANELGSVGQLLPETEARIGDDGQVYVRGPQVTRSYDGLDEPAVDADGWFCTGDMGSWSPGGNLVLNGRKKEILVTSYGKNIAPQKIEVLLKGIDGVSEAMVVADARPFTTALIWLEDELAEDTAFDFDAFDRAVIGVNEQLSHPEQVKRWIVASRPLSVGAGELTPNLKVRRNAVAQTRSDLVEALYEGWGTAPSDLLHRGEAS